MYIVGIVVLLIAAVVFASVIKRGSAKPTNSYLAHAKNVPVGAVRSLSSVATGYTGTLGPVVEPTPETPDLDAKLLTSKCLTTEDSSDAKDKCVLSTEVQQAFDEMFPTLKAATFTEVPVGKSLRDMDIGIEGIRTMRPSQVRGNQHMDLMHMTGRDGYSDRASDVRD